MLLKEFFEKVNFEIKSAGANKRMKNYPVCKELIDRMQLVNEAGGLIFALSLHLHPFNSLYAW